MRVLITGVDGYLGWTLAIHLAARGHEVAGHRQLRAARLGRADGLAVGHPDRADGRAPVRLPRAASARTCASTAATSREWDFVLNAYRSFRPEAVVYLGEMPSAPYSMIDVHHAVFTQTNNVMGTLVTLHALRDVAPDCHLVKLGTMGEYGTPNLDIPEGWFELEFRGRKERALFPRRAGSWYHQSKVHDSHNVEMACRLWGLRSTDIMQGVVYGTRIPELEGEPRSPRASTSTRPSAPRSTASARRR